MNKTREPLIAGTGLQDGERRIVLSGQTVFRCVDSFGLPLEIVMNVLREHHLGFDVIGFCRAAMRSGNFSLAKLRQMMVTARPEACPEEALERVLQQMAIEFPVSNQKTKKAIF